jgi:hypothetical protein
MNEACASPSGGVQRTPPRVVGLIDKPGHPAGRFAIDFQEDTTMIKTISAALLAVSVLAAPAMAGTARNTSHAAPAAKFVQVKPSVLNANARMGHHHHRHGHHHRHHR